MRGTGQAPRPRRTDGHVDPEAAMAPQTAMARRGPAMPAPGNPENAIAKRLAEPN